jgi:hypothetical protein
MSRLIAIHWHGQDPGMQILRREFVKLREPAMPANAAPQIGAAQQDALGTAAVVVLP